MRTLPRHLLLAAVVLTVCCAERQAVSATVDLQKVAAEMRQDASRSVQQEARRRSERHRHIRPAAVVWQDRLHQVYGQRLTPASPECQVVHVIFPPSRFRLPPPALLA